MHLKICKEGRLPIIYFYHDNNESNKTFPMLSKKLNFFLYFLISFCVFHLVLGQLLPFSFSLIQILFLEFYKSQKFENY